jgi:hypothetical protein
MEMYKSKIDYWLIILLSVVFGGIVIQMIIDQFWYGLGIVIIPILFIGHMFTKTYYLLTEKELVIKCGFAFKKVLQIKDIRKISESSDLISSPALSIDRLEILYNKFDSVLISPKKKYEFIEALKILKPDIEVKLKA